MDLPTCPACGQSVLDDDADECPFCGASMSGKSTATATKPAPAAAAARTPSAKTAAAPAAPVKRTGTASAPSEPKIASDDPFELERSADAKKKVVQLRSRPETGRRHEVKCPMCETVGYTGRKAAGMDVKCANPNCTFPYFTAPPLDEPDEESAEKSSEEQPPANTLFTPARIGIYAVAVVVTVFGIWYFGWRKPTQPTPSGNAPVAPVPGPQELNKTPVVPNKEKVLVKGDPSKDLREIRDNALRTMVTHSGLTNPLSGMKPLAWQWTVDAHARAGQFDAAEEHMQQLRVVTRDGPFYQSLPLLSVVWQRLEQGQPDDAKAAQEALDAALAAAKQLPQRNRQRYDVAAELAAVQIALGKTAEAEEILTANDEVVEETHASLFAHRVRYMERYDAEAAVQNRRLAEPQSPQRVAVTLILTGHGHWRQAWDWVKSLPAGSVRDDCAVAWAEMRFGSGQTSVASTAKPANDRKQPAKDAKALPDLDEVAALLSGPPARGTLYARVAFRLHDRQKADDARAALSKARAALNAIKRQSEPKTPAVKDVSTFAITQGAERENRETAAAALAELARAELRLEAQTGKAAWTALSRALAVARSIAPSPVAIAEMVNDARVGNDRKARFELARLSGLEGDALDQKVTEHRGHLSQINAAARFRSNLAQRLLVAAANWGGHAKSPEFLRLIWNHVEARTQEKAAGREAWYETRIPRLLAGNAEIAGGSQLAQDIRGKIGQRRHNSSEQLVWDLLQFGLRNKNLDRAAAALSDRKLRLDTNWVTRMVLAQAARFANAGDLDSGKRFIRGLQDRLLKMEALNVLAARATALGNAKAVWTSIRDGGALDSPQKVAMCHGLIAGLAIAPPPATGKKP